MLAALLTALVAPFLDLPELLELDLLDELDLWVELGLLDALDLPSELGLLGELDLPGELDLLEEPRERARGFPEPRERVAEARVLAWAIVSSSWLVPSNHVPAARGVNQRWDAKAV